MAVSREAFEEAAVADESQANFVKSFMDFLKQHRPIFYKVKEMFERFMDMESSETSDTQNSDLSREDEQHIPEKRKNEDLPHKQKLAEKDKSNEDLTQQVRNKEDQGKENEAKYHKLAEEYEGLLANKDEELKRIKSRFSDLKVLLERKDEELKNMKTRLACLSEKQVQRDQRKVEDTTSSNRPSEVEKDFTAFFDGERMDACEKMQKVYGSEEVREVGISYPRLACMIFETAYEEMKETKEAVLTLFKVISKSMIDLAPTMGAHYASRAKEGCLPPDISFNITPYSPELEYPIDVFDALVISLKENAHKCDLEFLEQGVTRKIQEKGLQWFTKEDSCRFSENLLAQLSGYIKACIRLTWRMVTLVPPMQLEYQSPTILKDIHRIFVYQCGPEMCSRRPTTEGQGSDEELEIACYLWPALLDGGGKLIRAGEVVCKVKEEISQV